MAIALAAAGVVLALALLLLLSGGRTAGQEGGPIRGESPRTCPLCGSQLGQGERIRSDLPPGTGDRIMRIYGCPHCWRDGPRIAIENGPVRICPYCRGEIPADGWAVARYFERPGRRHVHVLGCTRCRPTAQGAHHG